MFRFAAESVHVNVNTRSTGSICMLREVREEWGRSARCGILDRFPTTYTHTNTCSDSYCLSGR